MRIVAFSTLFPPRITGGAEKTVETLMLGLAEHGFDVHVVTTDPAEDSSRRQGPLQVHRVRLRNLYWPHHAGAARPPAWRRALWHARDVHNAPMGRAAARLLAEIRPDAVMTFNLQGFSTSVWGAVARQGQPLVHVLQDYWLLCPRTTMFKAGRNCRSPCFPCRALTHARRRSTRHLDAVVGVSRAVLQQHQREGLFPGVPIQRVIHNGRRMDVAAAAPPAREPGPLRIGFLGRVSREKGFELLLDELGRIEPKGWTLLVGGRCPADYLASLQRRHALEGVQFLGFVEPESFYRRIDLLVVPSLWREPLAGVAIEAMGCGVPVVVSDRGGLPEIVGPSSAARVFDPDEPGSLARLLTPFVRDPGRAAALRPEALHRARSFTVERQVAAYAALLGEVRAARRPPRAADGCRREDATPAAGGQDCAHRPTAARLFAWHRRPHPARAPFPACKELLQP